MCWIELSSYNKYNAFEISFTLASVLSIFMSVPPNGSTYFISTVFFFPQENLSDEQIAGMINYSVLIIMLQKRGLFSKQIFLKHSKRPLSFKLTRNAFFGTVISSHHQLKPAKHFFQLSFQRKYICTGRELIMTGDHHLK